jgi:hypothetical protein
MALIDMLTDISSFDYSKVGVKQGEYFGEDKATGFTPNRQTKNPTEYVENAITGLGTTDYFTPNYNPLESQNETSIHLTGTTPVFPGPVDYFTPDYNPLSDAESIHIMNPDGTDYFQPDYNPLLDAESIHIYNPEGTDYFIPNYNPLTDSSIFESSLVDYFTPDYNPLIDQNETSIHLTNTVPAFPGPVNYFLDTNATGYTLNRGQGDETEFIIGSGNDWNFSEGSLTNMIDMNSTFSTGNFVPEMVDTDFDTDNFGSNLITVNYPRLQGARQGNATNKPNQGDFGESHEYGVDGEDGKYHTELRLRAKTPGFWARLRGKRDDISAMYEFKGGMARALREPNNFGFDEPFIVHDIGDGYDSIGLDEGIFRGGLALNVVRTAEDAIRFAKWTLTPRGIIWNLKQFVLQAQNPIIENRIFNPLGVIGSIVPGLHLPRHTNGYFLDVNDPPSYDTSLDGVNITTPEEEEQGLLGSLFSSALGALGVSGAGRKDNRLVGLHKTRIETPVVASPVGGLLGALGLGNNAFEDPVHSVKSTMGPFGEKKYDYKDVIKKEAPKESSTMEAGNVFIDATGTELEAGGLPGLWALYKETEEGKVSGEKYNLGKSLIRSADGTENGKLYSVGVSNTLQVPYGGKFDKLNWANTVDGTLPKDFIKFRIRDAVNGKWLVFPAHLGTITDTVTPTWTPEKYIGRPDSIHLYGGADRSVSFDFKVAAFTKQEIPIIQEKMNYLMGLGYPTFKKILDTDDEERPVAPYIYLTIGDLFNNTPGYFSSIAITMEENATWEIDEGHQIPQVFSVGVEFVHVGKYLPHTLGKHYEVPWLKDKGVGKGNFGTFETDPRDGNTSRPTIGGTHKWSEGIPS